MIVRALYSQLAGGSADTKDNAPENYLSRRADLGWMQQILKDLPGRTRELDKAIGALSSRHLSEIDATELCILRLACYELAHCPDVPWKVAVTEAIRLTQIYCAEDSYRFVNGLTEQLARKLRPAEAVSPPA